MADLFLGGSIDPATHERTATDATGNVTVPSDSLTTHGVIVGMTGSGKTGLGVVLAGLMGFWLLIAILRHGKM